jgi:hypothetical protein
MVPLARVSRTSAGETYLERRPCQVLAGLISSVWVQRVAPDAEPYVHRAIPNGNVEFRCQVGSTPQLEAFSTGVLHVTYEAAGMSKFTTIDSGR